MLVPKQGQPQITVSEHIWRDYVLVLCHEIIEFFHCWHPDVIICSTIAADILQWTGRGQTSSNRRSDHRLVTHHGHTSYFEV